MYDTLKATLEQVERLVELDRKGVDVRDACAGCSSNACTPEHCVLVAIKL